MGGTSLTGQWFDSLQLPEGSEFNPAQQELRSQRLGDAAKKKEIGNGSLGVRAGCQPQYE